MSLRRLTYLGHPVLRRCAAPVFDMMTAEMAALAQDMVETMHASHGVGLAAPQVGVGQRLIVFYVPSSRAEDTDEVPVQVLFNPEFIPLDDGLVSGLEGCLSLPGLRGMVPRWHRIGYRGTGLDGRVIEREAEGFHARVVQHEIDHLDGVMYLDRITDKSSLLHEYDWHRRMQQAEKEQHDAQSAQEA